MSEHVATAVKGFLPTLPEVTVAIGAGAGFIAAPIVKNIVDKFLPLGGWGAPIALLLLAGVFFAMRHALFVGLAIIFLLASLVMFARKLGLGVPSLAI